MREYGMAFDAVLDLPLKRFWFLVNQVDRLRAEENLRQLQLLGSADSADALKSAAKSLTDELGQVFVWEDNGPTEVRIAPDTGLDPEFDRAGLRALKSLSGLREGHRV